MLVGNSTRRVAIVGGARIPFVRSMGAYAECSNQQMLTAALQALHRRLAPGASRQSSSPKRPRARSNTPKSRIAETATFGVSTRLLMRRSTATLASA